MKNQNHPKKGSSTKVEPIRQKAAIDRIKAALLHNKKYRDHCLFTFGINTAYRANELLSITIDQVIDIKTEDILGLKQSKNIKHRCATRNKTTAEALQLYLKMDNYLQQKMDNPDNPLFYSQRCQLVSQSGPH